MTYTPEQMARGGKIMVIIALVTLISAIALWPFMFAEPRTDYHALACRNKWSASYEWKYTEQRVCLVNIRGRWTPGDNVRIEP